MSSHETFGTTPGVPLEAHVEELRRRCEATARIQGGATHYLEEVRIFRDYAAERGLCHLPSALPELSRAPDDEGNEHQVWFQPETDTYLLEQINGFFTGNGWKRFTVGGEVAYFDPERQLAISDTHRGNIILMDDGLLAPIDLRVQPLSGALLDYVVKACSA